ncbi:hypothetical protein FB639_003485 [Coemansia asiatica]|nr:hypothetical protein FB639_003485 [Coemansia asiatica]
MNHEWLRPYNAIFEECSKDASGNGQDGRPNGINGLTVPDGAVNPSNTPAVPDAEAKKSKRHTIQVEYSTVSSQIASDSHQNEDSIPAVPSAEMIAQARAAAQAALMGEKPRTAADKTAAPASGVSSTSTKARSQSELDMADTVPDKLSNGVVSDRAVPKAIPAVEQQKQKQKQRPRPMSMFASTEMQPEIPDEFAMPPPISTIMDMSHHGGLSSASSIDNNMRGDGHKPRARPITLGPDQFENRRKKSTSGSQSSQRSRSNSEHHRRPSLRSNNTGTLLGQSNNRDGNNRRGRLPEIPPILPVNSTTGEELGIGVGAGIASQMPRHVEDVLFPDSPTPHSPRLQSSSGAASRVKSWFNRRTSRWGVGSMGIEQPLSIGSVLTDRRDQPEILQHMRVHRGVIDPDALSELPPDVLFSHVLQTLDELGFTVLKTEGLKIRVLRPRRQLPQSLPPPSLSVSPGRGRTHSTTVDGSDAADGSQTAPPQGLRRQSVPMVLPKATEEREWSAASKRATIMTPSQLDHQAHHGFALSEKSSYRRSRKLGSALTSVKRFFGSSIGSKRWFGATSAKGPAVSSSDSTAADSGDDDVPNTDATGELNGSNPISGRGLGIGVSLNATDAPHRRSLSESPYMNAKAIREQVNGIGGGLAVVPEEGEAAQGTAAMRNGQGGAAAGHVPASPFSHAASLGSAAGVAASSLPDHPFSNPFQTPQMLPPYGSSQVDNGDEVQMAIEVCKIKNLNNFFIVHVSRRKGNVWAYKHLYHLIIEKLALRSDDRRRYPQRP